MDFLVRNKNISAFVFFTVFCIVSLAVQSSSFTVSVEGVGSAIVLPFQKLYWYTQNNISKLWAGFTELGTIREELRLSREKLQQYEKSAEDLEEIKSENVRLKQLLNFQPKVGYETVPALILSKDPDNWYRTIIINRGSNDGIRVNMPVVAFSGNEKAIVGKIIEVRGSVSRILPVISPSMKMGVMLQDNRSPGLMQGYASSMGFSFSGTAQIDYISKSAQIENGEKVITSGQGGIFPPGLPVGYVIKTVVTKSSAFQRAIVRPIIEYDKVEEVYVIKHIPDKELVSLLQKDEKSK